MSTIHYAYQNRNVLSENPIPEDPTVYLPPAEAARVRAELATAVRAAGQNWQPVIDAHLRRYGVWVDPRETDERHNEEVRAAEVERQAREDRAADVQPATRGDLRRLEDNLTSAISRQDAALAKALSAVRKKAGAR